MKKLKIVLLLVRLACLLALCLALTSCDGESTTCTVVFTNNSSSGVGPCLVEDGKSPCGHASEVAPGNSQKFFANADISYYLYLVVVRKQSNVFSVPAGETRNCSYNGSSVYCGY